MESGNQGSGVDELAMQVYRENLAAKIDEYVGQKDTMTPAQKAEVESTIGDAIKNDVKSQNIKDDAKAVAESKDNEDDRVPDVLIGAARTVDKSVMLFAKAAKAGLIPPPAHPPSKALFNALVDKIISHGLTSGNASHLQPLIQGLLEKPNYVQFSDENGEPTDFENDLSLILSLHVKNQAERDLEEIVDAAGGDLRITAKKFKEKTLGAKLKRVQILERSKQDRNDILKKMQQESGLDLNRQMDGYLIEQIREGDPDSRDVKEALELIGRLVNQDVFYGYYERKFQEELEKVKEPGSKTASLSPEKQFERAAKNVTSRIHELTLFVTNKIFAPIIDSSGAAPWQALVQQSSRTMYSNAETLFNNFVGKMQSLVYSVSETDQRGKERSFFKFGNQTESQWLESQTKRTVEGKEYTVGGKMVNFTAPSHELQSTSSYKDFLNDLYLSARAERGLLESGINSNFLMRNGENQQDNSTFFKQLAGYSKQNIEANRIDELYKLPFAELVEAAKIQMSSYYKMKFAQNRWKRNPEMLQGLFSNLDEAEKEALKDMIISYKDQDVPEWAIKRAMIHARMHLSLINLEAHAMASYAEAPVNTLGDPTYKDPALKNLEVFRTWYNAEQWQMSDMFMKGGAFMPQVDRSWRIQDWKHEEITAEGEDIYDQAFHLGNLAKYGRKQYTKDMAPNIHELNPLDFGGVETQRGWRMKYPMMAWLRDLADNMDNPDVLDVKDKPRGLEHAWKRIENIGITPMQVLRDELLFTDGMLKNVDGKATHEEQYKNLFKYLYNRYFKDGVGSSGFEMSFRDGNYQDRNVKYKDIRSADDFWTQVVQPIVNRRAPRGGGIDPGLSEKLEVVNRRKDLQKIMNQALTVMAFERVPMDFVFVENPSRSQNGVTFMDELDNHFMKWNDFNGFSATKKSQYLQASYADILFVQQRARIISAQQMNEFVAHQADNPDPDRLQKTVFGETLGSLDGDRSGIKISVNQEKNGYLLDEKVIRDILEEKYRVNDPELSPTARNEAELRVKSALEVYKKIKERVTEKPDINPGEIEPSLTKTRLEMAAKLRGKDYSRMNKKQQKHLRNEVRRELIGHFEKARSEDMTSRLAWSMKELISTDTVAMPINDTAYQFLEFVRSGRDLVYRSIDAIANTQEAFKKMVGDGELNSLLKKYYRKEDRASLHEAIVKLRTSVKLEDVEKAEEAGIRVLQIAMDVMRINGDAENLITDTKYQLEHRNRSAFSTVVKEGPQYPLNREDRYEMISDYLHYGQFPKRVKESNQIWEYEKNWTLEEVMGNLGDIGAQVGAVADSFFGRDAGKLVRKKWKEKSGEGLRDREFSNVVHLLTMEGPKYLVIALAVIAILAMVKGYQSSTE